MSIPTKMSNNHTIGRRGAVGQEAHVPRRGDAITAEVEPGRDILLRRRDKEAIRGDVRSIPLYKFPNRVLRRPILMGQLGPADPLLLAGIELRQFASRLPLRLPPTVAIFAHPGASIYILFGHIDPDTT